MAGEPGRAADRPVRLVPLPAQLADAAVAGDLGALSPAGPDSLHCGRGWPHEDTAHALAFTGVGGQTYLVVDETGAVVGEAGTKGPPAADGHVEIGYGLAAPSRGRGIGTVAVRALVGRLRQQPGISEVEANVALDNLASQRLLERLGFACVGSGHSELRYSLVLTP